MTRFLTLILLVGGVTAVFAQQGLPDPTRPSVGGELGSGTPTPQGGTMLQSVILPKHGKPLAIIDGKRVAKGDKVGDAEVMRITETEVVLKGPEGIRTLKIAPDVEKRPSAKSTAKRGKGQSEKAGGALNEK